MEKLDQETRSPALCNTIIQFKPCDSFCSNRSHLGELDELSTKFNGNQKRGKITFIWIFTIDDWILKYSIIHLF